MTKAPSRLGGTGAVCGLIERSTAQALSDGPHAPCLTSLYKRAFVEHQVHALLLVWCAGLQAAILSPAQHRVVCLGDATQKLLRTQTWQRG